MFFLTFVITGRTANADAVGIMLHLCPHSAVGSPRHRALTLHSSRCTHLRSCGFAGQRSGLLLTKLEEVLSVKQYHQGPGTCQALCWEPIEPSSDHRFPAVFIRVLQRNSQPDVYYYICGGRLILKNWLMGLWGWQVQILQGRPSGWRLRDEPVSQVQSEGICCRIPSCLGRPIFIY